jgi:AcrR family transcriptional regulator
MCTMKSKRSSILAAATWLFANKGFRETSTTEVARLTDSADGTIFYHFESKEKLFLAVLEDVRQRIDLAFADFLPTTDDLSGLEFLERLVAFYLDIAAEYEAQFMLLHRHHAYDLAKVNDDCRVLLEGIYDRIIRTIEDAIRRGQEDATMGSVPVHKTALLVYTMIDGLVRLRHYNLYDASSLFDNFMTGCRRLVQARESRE